MIAYTPAVTVVTADPNTVHTAGVLEVNDTVNPGAADARQVEQVSADLQAAGVRLVVVSDFWEAAWGEPGPNAPLEAWLVSHFTEVARYGAYRVLVSGL